MQSSDVPTPVGRFAFSLSSFGGKLGCAPMPLVLASPEDGCGQVLNEAEVKGKVAMVLRGGCFFAEKVRNLQEAQAAGVIVVNTKGSPLMPMPAGELPVHDLKIPAVLVEHAAWAPVKRAVHTAAAAASVARWQQLDEPGADDGATVPSTLYVQPRQAQLCSAHTVGGCCPWAIL